MAKKGKRKNKAKSGEKIEAVVATKIEEITSEKKMRIETEIKEVIINEDKNSSPLSAHKKVIITVILIAVIAIMVGIVLFTVNSNDDKELGNKTFNAFLASSNINVDLLDSTGKVIEQTARGQEIKVFKEELGNDLLRIELNGKEYYIAEQNIARDKEQIVQEKVLYVRTSATVYESIDSLDIVGFVKKGATLNILGYDTVSKDGVVSKYKVGYEEKEGYVRGAYLVSTEEEANSAYDEEGTYQRHLKMGSSLGGGNAWTLDYFPVKKPAFEDNIMPTEVRALYINGSAIRNVEKYITFAKANNINSFVVDIKDNTMPAYASPVMEKYSPTNFKRAINTFDNYKKYIQRLLDEGFYVIGRITVFKDSYYIQDHPEDAIMDKKTNKPFNHNGSYWPSAFRRNVWEFNVALAVEAVIEMGFNEIQFDYVRFPDRTQTLEKKGTLNFNNSYNETKAQAIQSFLMYARDELHEVGAYISADIFGESANNYVTGYGQYWAAISNVVDVVSGMPYPDHFNKYEYGFSKPVWTIPYDLLKRWGKSVVDKQKLAPTPAIVRTWIQAYDTGKAPATKYDADKISDQIKGLYDNGLNGGWITWNSGSNLAKYEQIKEAFRKDYLQ